MKCKESFTAPSRYGNHHQIKHIESNELGDTNDSIRNRKDFRRFYRYFTAPSVHIESASRKHIGVCESQGFGTFVLSFTSHYPRKIETMDSYLGKASKRELVQVSVIGYWPSKKVTCLPASIHLLGFHFV